MKIHSAVFVRGVTRMGDVPDDGLPQVAFAGRSNVGKSSLINCLVERRALARTSNTPGRTQEINFFLINGSFHFVDLPGFGFAKVPVSVRRKWGRLIEGYLKRATTLRAVIFLIDARHGPQPNDLELLEWLLSVEVPFVPVLTKADKLPRTKIAQAFSQLQARAPVLAMCEPVAFSAKTRLGRQALLDRIEALVS